MRLLPLFIFWCLWFLNFSTRTVFSPILPLIEENLALSHGEAGGLFASLSIGYATMLVVSGRFASVLGYRNTVVTGLVGTGLVLIALQWAESYLLIHFLFFLLGVVTGPYLPAILSIITEMYDSRHWGKAIGFHDSATSLSFFAIPILVALGLQVLHWKRLLLIIGVASLLLPVFFLKVSAEPGREKVGQGGYRGELFKSNALWIIGLLWIFAAGSCLGIYSILPLYLVKERGIDFHFANTLFGISRVGGVFFSVLIGFLIDRYGYRLMLMLSMVTTGLSTIALALSSTLVQITAALILQATLSLAFFPVGFSAVSKLTPLSERSLALGVVISIGVAFGMGGTPFILGVVADHWSFRAGILCLGLLTTLSSLFVRFLDNA